MSNSNWDESFEDSQEESEEHIPGKKYIRKSKELRGKNDKEISPANKKKKCEFYNRGACIKGSQCPFTHTFIPDVAKNNCSKGDSCHYSHNTKRYPCKMFHFNQSCLLNDQCPFSHEEIDPDFEEEFLRDNEEFLISAFKSNANLPNKYSLYVQNNDLLNEDRKKEVEPTDDTGGLPFFFGLHTYQTVSREEKVRANSKKISESKKSSTNELPFIIRLMTKNRERIPEKLEDMINENEDNSHSESYPGSVKSSSEFEKNELEIPISDKTSHGTKLTPESKPSRLDHEYICSYN